MNKIYSSRNQFQNQNQSQKAYPNLATLSQVEFSAIFFFVVVLLSTKQVPWINSLEFVEIPEPNSEPKGEPHVGSSEPGNVKAIICPRLFRTEYYIHKHIIIISL